MNRFILSVAFFLQLVNMITASEEIKLMRTYSTHPSTDVLQHALLAGDIPIIEENLGMLPLSLDAQYSYLGLARSQDVLKRLLTEIYTTWTAKLAYNCKGTLDSLVFEIKQLLTSYELEELDHGFRQMLSNIRIAALNHNDVKGSKGLRDLARKIPHYSSKNNTLQMQIAYNLAHGDLKEVPPHLLELVKDSRRVKTTVRPLSRWNSLNRSR